MRSEECHGYTGIKDPHYDYKKNLRQAEVFIENFKKKHPGVDEKYGFRVQITDSKDYPKSIFMISLQFPVEFHSMIAPIAAPVFMHQDNRAFRGMAGGHFEYIFNILKEYLADHPEPKMIQPEMELESPRIDLLA